MRDIVAAFASDDPETAPNNADAASVATARPPRNPESITCAALNSSPDRRDSEATSPMRMNSGTTERVYDDATSNGAVPVNANVPCQPNTVRLPKKPTHTSAIQIGTRRIRRTKRATTPVTPISDGFIRP